MVDIIFLTFNRLYYTKITLPALLNSVCKNPFNIHIVDNGSTDGTVEYLQKLSHSKIASIIFNKKNQGLVKPTKKFWQQSNADLVGKIDNDILVPPDWIGQLTNAHKKIPHLGVLGYCHFRKEDFDSKVVQNTIQFENGTYFRPQPWIGGNYLMKRDTTIQHNYYRQSRKKLKKRILYGFNKYQERLSEKGYTHGYLADSNKELLLWEHLDDPRHSHFHKDENYFNIRNMNEIDIIKWYQNDAKMLLENYRN